LEQYSRFFVLFRNSSDLKNEREKNKLAMSIRFIMHDEMEHFFEIMELIKERKLESNIEAIKGMEKIGMFWMMFYTLDVISRTNYSLLPNISKDLIDQVKKNLKSINARVLFRIVDREDNTAHWHGSFKKDLNVVKAISKTKDLRYYVTPRSYLSVIFVTGEKGMEGVKDSKDKMNPKWNPKTETIVCFIKPKNLEELVFSTYSCPFEATQIFDCMITKYDVRKEDIYVKKLEFKEMAMLIS
jgi:hypothetical protein